jgi:GMP synthase-like glutamine amidotransferase
MPLRPFLILDCYFDEKGSAPNFCALLGDEPREVVRAVRDPLPGDLSPYRGILISGSRANLPDPEPWMEPLLELIRQGQASEIPIMGICFGHQAIAVALRGPDAVRRAPCSELGWETIRVLSSNRILANLAPQFTCFVSHFDEVTPGLPGLEVFARSDRCEVQAYQVQGSPIWGMQFHPEMDPLESEALVRSNLKRHETLAKDPEQILGERTDGRSLGAVILKNFIEFCTARTSA